MALNQKILLSYLCDIRDGLNGLIKEIGDDIKGGSSGKKPAKDEDDDLPDEDEEEEDARIAKGQNPKKPAKAPVKASKKPVVEDDEDEPEDDDDDEPAPKKPVKKPAKKPEPEDDEDEPEDEEEGDIDSMPRAALIHVAKKLGIETAGKQVDVLRKEITQARKKGNSKTTPKPAPKKKPTKTDDDDEDDGAVEAKPLTKKQLRVLQDCIANLVENNYDELTDAIEELGCGGDCYNCPHPEEADVASQVRACLKSVTEGLELDLPVDVAKLV